MALTTGFFSSSRLILVGVHRALTGGCEGSPLIPRAELSLWWAGRGAYLILKDEWRLTRRSHPASLPRTPTPVSLPPISARAYTPIYRYAKKPPAPPPPIWGGEAGGFHELSVTALSVTARSVTALSANAQAAVMPWVLRSGGTPVRVRAVRCRARARCRGLRTGVRRLRVRRAGSAAWRSSRA